MGHKVEKESLMTIIMESYFMVKVLGFVNPKHPKPAISGHLNERPKRGISAPNGDLGLYACTSLWMLH
jgi:hypothetical protein